MGREDAHPPTVRLLSRYKAGDRTALDELYGRYFDRMLGVVRLRIGPRLRAKLDSMDVVQETFAASLRGVGDFRPRGEGDFFHWLCTVAENRIRDLAKYFRAGKRDQAAEVPLQPVRPTAQSVFGPINALATSSSPATKAARAEDLERLETAVDALPKPQREALLLVRYERLTFKGAARAMGRSPDAVRMLVGRAIVALGKSLGATKS